MPLLALVVLPALLASSADALHGSGAAALSREHRHHQHDAALYITEAAPVPLSNSSVADAVGAPAALPGFRSEPPPFGEDSLDWVWFDLDVPPESSVPHMRSRNQRIYGVSRIGHWRRHKLPEGSAKASLSNLFNSALWKEWVFFFFALCCFIRLHVYLLDWPSRRTNYWLAFLIWLAAAGCFNVVVWRRLGAEHGRTWLCGYLQELVFSMENVFIFHTIISALQKSRMQAQKALFVVVCCQVLFQMVFFMGLANWLQSIQVLPYILGVWLVYLGVETLKQGDDHEGFNIEESSMLRAFQACLGDRLSQRGADGTAVLLVEDGTTKVTMLGPCIFILLIADFVMEVDVTLTKIEAIPNHYIGFTSSAAAAFAMPTLFFVARDLFARFAYLKYGVTFVLIFFGSELLLHQVVHIPDMIGIVIILVVMLMCIALSKYYSARADHHMRLSSRFSDDSATIYSDDTVPGSKPTVKADRATAVPDSRLPASLPLPALPPLPAPAPQACSAVLENAGAADPGQMPALVLK